MNTQIKLSMQRLLSYLVPCTSYLVVLTSCLLLLSSCSDEPDKSNFYTFKGQMMSDYLKTHENFSQFNSLVERVGLTNMLSTYGEFTGFAPTNEAMSNYLVKKGLNSFDQLTREDCDTLVRTHLVRDMYTTADMNSGTLSSANMNGRYIEVSHGLDDQGRSVVFLNRTSHIIFELRDDSVENGFVQPVSEVLESSNRMILDIIEQNPNISLFYNALHSAGFDEALYRYNDEEWEKVKGNYPRIRYVSHVNKETATVPDHKRIGFTIFTPTDSVLRTKYGIITLEQLYQKACQIYDAQYPEDVDKPYHSFENIKHEKNPLHRFLAYHILTRSATGLDWLTPYKDICIETSIMNPVDWYETMLPHAMMKFERLTVRKWVGPSVIGQRYINRRWDDEFQIPGVMIHPTVETEYDHNALNGWYYYVDDILAFDDQTRNEVFNGLIRMDFSTIFPELMTNDIRLNRRGEGDAGLKVNDPDYDETGKYGRNYYFPNGYLDGVTINEGSWFVYRRPRDWYDSYEGDEMNLFKDFDFTFKLPPVPFDGQWQIRLGFAAEPTRGVAQIYYDDKPQGIPLDMTKSLNDASIIGANWKADYLSMSSLELSTDQKELKNKGYYRGPTGGYHFPQGGNEHIPFARQPHTYRMVLCTTNINCNEDHYLRIRCVSAKQGNDNEFMLDFLELVPRSVFGVTDEGAMEPML